MVQEHGGGVSVPLGGRGVGGGLWYLGAECRLLGLLGPRGLYEALRDRSTPSPAAAE
jgi:hypothetical protein